MGKITCLHDMCAHGARVTNLVRPRELAMGWRPQVSFRGLPRGLAFGVPLGGVGAGGLPPRLVVAWGKWMRHRSVTHKK